MRTKIKNQKSFYNSDQDFVREVWLKATVDIDAILEEDRQVSVTLYTKWYFESNDDTMKKKVKAIVEEESDNETELKDKKKKIEDQILETGPINRDIPVRNVLHSEPIEKLQRVDWKLFPGPDAQDSASNEESLYVFIQLAWKLKLQVEFDFKRFPVDVQEIPIRFIIRASYRLLDEHPKWIVGKEDLKKGLGCFRLYKGDDKMLTFKSNKLSEKHLQWQAPSIAIKQKKDLEFVIRYKRATTFFFFNVILPIFIIVAVTLLSLLLDRNSADFRFENLTIGLLQMVVFLQYTNSLSPDKSALTFSSHFVLVSLSFYFLATLKVVAVNYIISQNAAGLFSYHHLVSLEAYCGSEDVDSIISQSYPECTKFKKFVVEIDDTSTWILISLWVVINCLTVLFLVWDSYSTKRQFPNCKEREIEWGKIQKDKQYESDML